MQASLAVGLALAAFAGAALQGTDGALSGESFYSANAAETLFERRPELGGGLVLSP